MELDRSEQLDRVSKIHSSMVSLIEVHGVERGDRLDTTWTFSVKEPKFRVSIDQQAAFGVYLVRKALEK